MFIDSITQWSSLPGRCKLIVTGRNDRMPDTFRAVCKQVTLLTGADVNEDVNKDICHFFETRIADFGECLDSEILRQERVFERLTSRAASLFIWAETVVRFMEEGIHEERLERVLNGSMGGGDNITKLYQQILELSFPKSDGYTLNVFHQVVSAIILAKVPLHEDDLPHFISQSRSSVKSILSKLSSVLSIGTDRRVRMGHLSFSEFLCDPDQCPKQFYIDQRVEDQKLLMACFRLMRGLRFNICGLESSYLFNHEVKGLSQRIEARVGSPLLYSCRFWAAHLRDTMASKYDHNAVMTEIEVFLYDHLLFWLEVMSLTNEVAAANISLLTVAPLITVCGFLMTSIFDVLIWLLQVFSTKLCDFVRDASRFIVNFYEPISTSAPHIYVSALPFLPSESLIAKHYKPSFSNTMSVLGGVDKNWPACTNIFHGHTNRVCSVAFSPDGTRVASGSYDKTIRIGMRRLVKPSQVPSKATRTGSFLLCFPLMAHE
jgi:WD domain, G-beta repeat